MPSWVAPSSSSVQYDAVPLNGHTVVRAMDLFRPIALTTQCPFKGTASYWTLDLDGTAHDGIAWSYEEPIDAASGIAGHLCFFDDRATVTTG